MIFVGSCMFGEDPFFSTLHTVLHSLITLAIMVVPDHGSGKFLES